MACILPLPGRINQVLYPSRGINLANCISLSLTPKTARLKISQQNLSTTFENFSMSEMRVCTLLKMARSSWPPCKNHPIVTTMREGNWYSPLTPKKTIRLWTGFMSSLAGMACRLHWCTRTMVQARQTFL